MIEQTMIRSVIERLNSAGTTLTQKIQGVIKPAWKVMTLPLMDGILFPQKAVSVTIERGSISMVSGVRFLSKIRIKDSRTYPGDDKKYVSPENLASLLSFALKDIKAEGAKIVLTMPLDWVIVRTAHLPVTVKENLTGVMAYELDRLTPLNSDNAYYDFQVKREENGMVTLVVVATRVNLVDQYLQALRQRSIEVEKVTVSFPPDGAFSYNGGIEEQVDSDGVAPSETHEASTLEALWMDGKRFNLLSKGAEGNKKTPKAVTLVLVCLFIMVLILCMMVPLIKEQKRLAQIEHQISLRKEDAMKVDAVKREADGLMQEMTAIRAFKEMRPMALEILKELTTILPKSAWLTRVRMTETTVDIEGYAASASEILPKLEESKYFKKVEFSSPTVRDMRLNADRFVMKMEIEGIVKEEAEKAKDGTKK